MYPIRKERQTTSPVESCASPTRFEDRAVKWQYPESLGTPGVQVIVDVDRRYGGLEIASMLARRTSDVEAPKPVQELEHCLISRLEQ